MSLDEQIDYAEWCVESAKDALELLRAEKRRQEDSAAWFAALRSLPEAQQVSR